MTPQSLTAEAKQIADRLRNDEVRQGYPHGSDPLCEQAADLITRQAEEIERLREKTRLKIVPGDKIVLEDDHP